jgi:hypothetical protein
MRFSIARRKTLFFSFLGAALVAAGLGCSSSPATVNRRSETTETVGDSKTKTTTESTQVGANLTSKTEVKGEKGGKLTTELFVGTVTAYKPAKSIEVMTGEKKTKTFDLDEKYQTVDVDPTVEIGSRVRLTKEKSGDGIVRISVVPDHS